MKNHINILAGLLRNARLTFLVVLLAGASCGLQAQETTPTPVPENKPVKNTFGSGILMDNQTVMVPIKGTLEMAIQHRFGPVNTNEEKDLWGVYAPSNIRIGFNYTPINKLQIGFGITKFKMEYDFNLKYALLKQMQTGLPVSLTYYGNFAVDSRDAKYFGRKSDRLSFYHELMLASKITNEFSVQVAGTLSYFNSVEGYIAEDGSIKKKMNNAHLGVSAIGRYKVSPKMNVIVGLDQPLTQHPTNNPYPNVCFGIEIVTSSHAFQIFAGNYQNILPQNNNVFNQYNYKSGQFLLGFNITRLWNL
jgi:hypothetical protein